MCEERKCGRGGGEGVIYVWVGGSCDCVGR